MLDRRTTLSLLNTPRVGRQTATQILRLVAAHGDTPGNLAELLDFVRGRLPRSVDVSPDAIRRATDEADAQIAEAERLRLKIVWHGSEHYPRRLLDVPDPPVVLYVRGSLAALNASLAVAVIGTREPSDWGIAVARRFGVRFSEAGCVVVSGLAYGCDTHAHEGCLSAGGTAVAVLAHGLHTVSPTKNRDLADRIVSAGGCLVSEYAPGVRAMRNFFVERDRIQSGLSDAVVVVETDTEGGTMHTVRAALAQDRLVACLLHDDAHKNHPKSRGNQALLERGDAVPLGDAADLNQFVDRIRNRTQRNYHVVPNGDEWLVKREGADRATSVHRTQADAVQAARLLVGGDEKEVVVHGEVAPPKNRVTSAGPLFDGADDGSDS
ncbi:MAG: hypothetical protein FLDDKLPJ_03686 [Phycisphaerae bacterium]|nr:hypothetical protein [Phycisphaerae bacterium]